MSRNTRLNMRAAAIVVVFVLFGWVLYFMMDGIVQGERDDSNQRIEECIDLGGTVRTDHKGYFDGCTYTAP